MIIELSLILFIYYFFLVLFFIFTIFNLYHIFKFGFVSIEGYLVTFIFVAGIVVVLFFTYELTVMIDWSRPLLQIG